MIEITERLDKIASSLESRGLLKEAESVDVISNTIENLGYDYFVKKAFLRRKNADLYSRIVSAKEALKNGKWSGGTFKEAMHAKKEGKKVYEVNPWKGYIKPMKTAGVKPIAKDDPYYDQFSWDEDEM